MRLSAIRERLTAKTLGRDLLLYDCVDSTSTVLRSMYRDAAHGSVIVAREQRSGRGRTGKTFFAPRGDGLYMTVLLTKEPYISDPLFTVRVSYAVCRALDEVTDTKEKIGIKWVNDLYYLDRKLGGILCEAVNRYGKRGILLGIGINTRLDHAKLPSELRTSVISLDTVAGRPVDPACVCAAILNHLEEMYENTLSDEAFLAAYRARSVILGQPIHVLKNGNWLPAFAESITDDGALAVTYDDGGTENLTAGEVTIRKRK